MINAGSVFSILGNPNSRIPLAVKDFSATGGMTAGSFVTGKEEGFDRFIDEIGTEAIWLFGIPAFRMLFDKTAFKALGLDSKFDARNLKDKDVFEKIKQYAPTEDIKKNIEKIGLKEKLFKNAVSTKFVVSTALTVGSYLWLTKFKQKYTEKKIRENLINEYNEKKSLKNNSKQLDTSPLPSPQGEGAIVPSFKGIGPMVESFAFSPVKNMWILDGFITGARLKDSRSPQEFIGYAIKEAFTLCFMYYAGDKIQQYLEKRAMKKYNKTIGLDARVLESGDLKKTFDDGSIEKSLKEFKSANTSSADLYEFLHKNPDNMIVKTAKTSGAISMYKEPQGLFKKAKVTDKIDTREFIDLKEIEGINNKIEQLYKQYKEALSKGETSEKFFAGVKKLKRGSILTNIGTCILALGVVTPGIMLLKRFTAKDDEEFQTKKEIREQLIKEGVIERI